MRQPLKWIELDLESFEKTWALQKKLHHEVKLGHSPDCAILVQHPPTYTFGKTSLKEHLLFNAQELQKRGISVFDCDRGGDITFHGPGQLVCYPILNLKHHKEDIHWFLRQLEEVVILTLETYGILGERLVHPDPKKNYTGVWAHGHKICAMGIKVSHWTTMHGLALNVSTDLNYFDGIVPCGISDKKVTSMKKLSQKDLVVKNILQTFKTHFEDVFYCKPHPKSGID